MGKTKIEWTEHTWNPFTGCSPASSGCHNCYAKTLAESMKRRGINKYFRGFLPTVHPDEIEKPDRWRKRRMVFVCSMADIFHDDFSDKEIKSVFDVMNRNGNHIFQVLTKRADRMSAFIKRNPVKSHIWVGVTVEDRTCAWRLKELRKIDATVRFVSCEPLLERIDLDLHGIHWLIAGGETGLRARICKVKWLTSLRDQAKKAGIPFFMKQVGAATDAKRVLIDEKGVLEGEIYTEMPMPSGKQEELF